MFDIGWQELFIIAAAAVIVIGPKDLPRALKTVTGFIRKIRGMAREFQSGVDDMVREAELDDLKKEMNSATGGGDLRKSIEDAIDPTGEIKQDLDMKDIEAGLDKAARDETTPPEPDPAPEPAPESAPAPEPEPEPAPESAPAPEPEPEPAPPVKTGKTG